MPLYEYHCQDCGQHVTIWRSFSETSPPSCPICGGGNLIRLISKVSVAKSERDRIKDLSWIDKDLLQRLNKRVPRKYSPGFEGKSDGVESN